MDVMVPLFHNFRTLFLLVKLAFMPALTLLWHRPGNTLPLAGLSLLPLWVVEGPDQGLAFSFMCKSGLWPMAESSGGSVAKRPHSNTRTENHQSGRKTSGGGASASFTDSKKKLWDMMFLMSYSLHLHKNDLHLLFRLLQVKFNIYYCQYSLSNVVAYACLFFF